MHSSFWPMHFNSWLDKTYSFPKRYLNKLTSLIPTTQVCFELFCKRPTEILVYHILMIWLHELPFQNRSLPPFFFLFPVLMLSKSSSTFQASEQIPHVQANVTASLLCHIFLKHTGLNVRQVIHLPLLFHTPGYLQPGFYHLVVFSLVHRYLSWSVFCNNSSFCPSHFIFSHLLR